MEIHNGFVPIAKPLIVVHEGGDLGVGPLSRIIGTEVGGLSGGEWLNSEFWSDHFEK